MRHAWLIVLALPVALVPVAGPADAASCKVMTVGYAFAAGKVIAIQPDSQDIAYGGCVQFTNNLDLNATITVSGGYSVTLGPKESTPRKDAYVGTSSGRHQVNASSGPSSADGSITVGPAPASPKPTHAPSPHRTAGTSPKAASSPHPASSSTGPRVAPVPPRVGGSVPQRRRPSPPGPPPSVAPTPLVVTPSPSPTPDRREPAVVAFPIEPPSGRGAGLPGALAALAIVGTAAGLVRVLLAEPVGAVDGRARSVGGTS